MAEQVAQSSVFIKKDECKKKKSILLIILQVFNLSKLLNEGRVTVIKMNILTL